MAPLSPTESRKLSSGFGKGKGKHQPSVGVTSDQNGAQPKVSDRRLAEERALWISEKQERLAGVLERHDDLVREVFHLEKFVTMVSFDPKVAKEDKSAVFQEYKARYDLLEKMTDAAASSTRTTRSAHTERLHHLNVTTSPGGSERRRTDNSPTKSSNTAIWDIISNAKAKTKRLTTDAGTANGMQDTDTADENTLISVMHDSKTKGKIATSPRIKTSMLGQFDDAPSRSKRVIADTDATDDAAALAPRKKRKADQPPIPGSVKKPRHFTGGSQPRLNGRDTHETEATLPASMAPPLTKSQRPIPSRTSARRASQSQIPAESPAQTVPSNADFSEKPSSKQAQDPLSSPTIRRIKLIVRKPPPMLSNPRQRPPRPAHGSSLTAYLSSHRIFDDRDVGEDALGDMAQKEAALRDRIDAFRREGRLLPDSDVPYGVMTGTEASKPVYGEAKRAPDVWDFVVQAIVVQNRGRRNKGRHIASQIASKIQAYWDGYAAREDKARLQEEKRLRALAKSTIKMVTNEWKKAVFHIREKERLRLEAEEMRLGHEHLDAILDQSGQILETQQVDLIRGDLSRSRSRSSSASGLPDGWTSEESDRGSGSDEEDDADEKVDAGEEQEAEDGDSDTGTRGLLDGTSTDAEGLGVFSHDEPQDKVGSDSEDYENDSGVAIDELVDSRSSSIDRMDEVNDEEVDSVSSPTTSLLLPRSPPEVSDTDMRPDVGLMQSSEPTLVESELSANDLWNGIDSSNDFDVVKKVERIPAKVEDDFQPPSSDTPWSIELEESPTSPIEPKPDAEADVNGGHAPTPENAHLAVSAPYPRNDEQVGISDHTMNAVEEDADDDFSIPEYLKPYAVAPVEWDFEAKVRPPALLRGILRPYQQSGLEWLASLHTNNLNGILADEMGLGKTIQAISLLAHLACDRGIWGPHLIVVPTSVLLNWEMEFKKFLPGFKILSYHGSTKRRKELRQGWNDKQHFNVCITSYTLASRDAHIFKRKAWYYMILDEAHMIKNFKSQRWNILLMFRSFRRLLLTGTPLQNNLTELWALLQFLMSGANFANLKEFGDWFSNPLEKAIEMGTVLDDETQQRVSKLHTVLRPYLLRRLKRDVEKELPSKFDHLVLCPLSKRQRFLYDEFMSRAQTRDALQSGIYQKVANILMQLRKVCNHPDLFEVRPIVTSFAMERSAIADFEIKELLVRRRLLESQVETVNLDMLGICFVDQQNKPLLTTLESRRFDATSRLPIISEVTSEPLPKLLPKDTRTIAGFKRYTEHRRATETTARWSHIGYLNDLRCKRQPVYSEEKICIVKQLYRPLLPASVSYPRTQYLNHVDTAGLLIKSYPARADEMASVIDKFAFVTPPVVARDLPQIALAGHEELVRDTAQDLEFDAVLHRASVKLQIAFPDPSLLQYDCGKLQELTRLLREKKAGGHRVLIFTQMTKILDILEVFLNFHGYLYLRLDGATKIEDRQYITERFNADPRVFCFIASSRSGGVGINLTGADTVVFYDSDFNPQMDRQCEDRAHRIGQIRDVHIYRFISQHTVEEAMLRKANQKRSLDDIVIQKGEFDWRTLFGDEVALTKALGEFEDKEDAHAAAVAAREEHAMEGADVAEFGGDAEYGSTVPESQPTMFTPDVVEREDEVEGGAAGEDTEEGGTVVDFMLAVVARDYECFRDWRL